MFGLIKTLCKRKVVCTDIVCTSSLSSSTSSSSSKHNRIHARHLNFFSKTQPKEDPFILCRTTADDTNEILDLMWEAFHPDEPATHAIGLGYHRNPIFDDRACKTLSKGFSIAAKCKYSGCLVGAALNDSVCPWDPDLLEQLACTMECTKIAQLLMFWAFIQRAPELWKKYCQMQIFEIESIFVRQGDRKKGVARRLIKASRDLGADSGFKLIRVDASNIHTSRICEKLKFKKVHEIPYCAYIGEDGQPIFKVPDPNDAVRVYIDTPHAMQK